MHQRGIQKISSFRKRSALADPELLSYPQLMPIKITLCGNGAYAFASFWSVESLQVSISDSISMSAGIPTATQLGNPGVVLVLAS